MKTILTLRIFNIFYRFLPKDIDTWIRTMIRDVIKNRDDKKEKRNDFLQSVLDLRDKFDGKYCIYYNLSDC